MVEGVVRAALGDAMTQLRLGFAIGVLALLAMGGCSRHRERAGDGDSGPRRDAGTVGFDGEPRDGRIGDDGGGVDAGTRSDGGGGVDSGMVVPPPVPCPRSAPPPPQMGACCWRASNAGRLNAPELRMAGLSVSAPPSLTSPIVGSLISAALDEERFNWLLRFD